MHRFDDLSLKIRLSASPGAALVKVRVLWVHQIQGVSTRGCVALHHLDPEAETIRLKKPTKLKLNYRVSMLPSTTQQRTTRKQPAAAVSEQQV
jgi:hypothetical protein